MYVYIPMGSMTIAVEKYKVTTDGLESLIRIPCLDALLGIMVELKSDVPAVETPVVETSVVETSVVETPVVETPVVEPEVIEAPVIA